VHVNRQIAMADAVHEIDVVSRQTRDRCRTRDKPVVDDTGFAGVGSTVGGIVLRT
jgi:hypothetical protein